MKKLSVSAIFISSAVVCSALLSLTACNHTANSPAYPFAEVRSGNSVLTIDPIRQTQISYDTAIHDTDAIMSSDYTVYVGNPSINCYVIGPGTGGAGTQCFSIFSLDDRQVSVKLSLPAGEAIYPLAFSDRYLFFLKSGVDMLDSTVVRYDPTTQTLTEYSNLRGIILSGAICGNTLYYIIFNEVGHSYTLWQADASNADARPEVIRDAMNRSDIYAQGEDLYLTDNRYLYHGDKKFHHELRNYFIGEKYLLQYVENNAGIDVVIVDTDTGETAAQAPDILGISVDGDEIVLYCRGTVERFRYR